MCLGWSGFQPISGRLDDVAVILDARRAHHITEPFQTALIACAHHNRLSAICRCMGCRTKSSLGCGVGRAGRGVVWYTLPAESIYLQAGRQAGGQTGRRTYRQVDSQADGSTDRQTFGVCRAEYRQYVLCRAPGALLQWLG
uniref:Uncharacterized protein n=1 Tax=Eutreptiella gymnastica TaxID=73025 RepID=A0A7S4C735_9EUGL